MTNLVIIGLAKPLQIGLSNLRYLFTMLRRRTLLIFKVVG